MIVNIAPPRLHPGQRRIIESASRFTVISAGRRFGKTILAIEWLMLSRGGAIDGAAVAVFAPTYKLLMEIWRAATATLYPIISASNRAEMRISLHGGGTIDFWTLEDPNAGRGRSYDRIVIDEAAHTRNLQTAWELAISPTLTQRRGSAWFISTPNGLNYFYELYKRGLDAEYPDWNAFKMPTSANPYVPADELEARRNELPELVFRQEYLAEFVQFGAGLVRPEMILESEPPRGLRVVLGIDLAISERSDADYTAIVAMARDTTGIIYILEVERFRAAFNTVLERIKSAAARHNPTVIAIEQTQYQAAVVQELLRTTTLPVVGVRPDRDKITRFLPLLTRYEQRMVVHHPAYVPAVYRDEILAFPRGEHDDMVDAAAYAFSALNRQNAVWGVDGGMA